MKTLLDISRKPIQANECWVCGDPFHKMRVEWVDRVWAPGVVERGRRRILTPRRRTEASWRASTTRKIERIENESAGGKKDGIKKGRTAGGRAQKESRPGETERTMRSVFYCLFHSLIKSVIANTGSWIGAAATNRGRLASWAGGDSVEAFDHW